MQQIDINSSEKVSISKHSTRDWRLPMYERHGKVDGRVLLDYLHEVGKPPTDVFMLLYSLRNTGTNISTLPKLSTKARNNNQTAALNVLERKDIIRKVPKQALRGKDDLSIIVPPRTYMINPYLLIPVKNSEFSNSVGYWDQLDSKSRNN